MLCEFDFMFDTYEVLFNDLLYLKLLLGKSLIYNLNGVQRF